MIIGDAEMKGSASIDREKSERQQTTLTWKRRIELALHFTANHRDRIASAGKNAQLHTGGTTLEHKSPMLPINDQAGQAEIFQLQRD